MIAVPNPFSPDGDGHDDRTVIRYENPRPAGWMSIRIYDIRGRLVRFLANNEPSGGMGTVVWDGYDDNRRRVRIGVYIILLEIAGEDRETAVTVRGSVVVAGKLR
jgi:flagellar hook assembly protein FlgD